MRPAGIVFSICGEQSLPLTFDRTVAAIPFACRYRLVDFSLSMMVAAGVTDVFIVADRNYRSLSDHIGSGKDWDLARRRGGIRLVTPFRTVAPGIRPRAFGSTSEAFFGMRRDLEALPHKELVLARGDLVANIDLSSALARHREVRASCTAVLACRGEGEGLDLGVRILDRECLLALLSEAERHPERDLFTQPSIAPTGANVFLHTGYASFPGSLEEYFNESISLTRREDVMRALFCEPGRPVLTKVHSSSPVSYRGNCHVRASMVADDCVIEGTVENSILFRGVRIGRGATVKDSILFGGAYVGEGSMLSSTVAEKNAVVGDGRLLSGHETMPLYIPKDRKV